MKDANELYEEKAAKFYKDTGVMAPGKDGGMYPQHTHDDRFDCWWRWLDLQKCIQKANDI